MISKNGFCILMDGYRKNSDAFNQFNEFLGVYVDEGPLGAGLDAIVLALIKEFSTPHSNQGDVEEDFSFFWEVEHNGELAHGVGFMLTDSSPYTVNSYESFYDYLVIKYFLPN